MPKEPAPLMLQDLIEKVMVLKKAVEREKKQNASLPNTLLAEQLRFLFN